ncbi:hypothetical protein [Trinickia sp.]|uniref:hypothetical protein n=1 Tax=Trinickia sp. TaxID=2571163 RepID=UPI003F7FA106
MIAQEAAASAAMILMIMDSFSDEPIDGPAIVFLLGGSRYEPLYRAGGLYVFPDLTDVPSDVCTVTVKCKGFFDAHAPLTLISLPLCEPLAELTVRIDLEPNALYDYPADTTVLRGQVRSSDGPLNDIEVSAMFTDRLGLHCCSTKTSGQPGKGDFYGGRYALALPAVTPQTIKVKLDVKGRGYEPYADSVEIMGLRSSVLPPIQLQAMNA